MRHIPPGQKLYTMTSRLGLIVGYWLVALVITIVPIFMWERAARMERSIEVTMGALAQALAINLLPGAAPSTDDLQVCYTKLESFVDYPLVQGIALYDRSGQALIVWGTVAAQTVNPTDLSDGVRRSPNGELFYVRSFAPGEWRYDGEALVRPPVALVIWPDTGVFDSYYHSNLRRWAIIYAVSLTVLLWSLVVVLRNQYLHPLRQLTFAVRDNHAEVLQQIARTTRSVEFHTMIASFLGLLGETERRQEELEEAVHNRTAELDAVQDRMVRQEKLASLGGLAAGVAHEINNPAGYVIGNLEVLKEYVEALQQRSTLCNQLIAEARRSGLGNDDTDRTVAAIRELDENLDYVFVMEDIPKLFTAVTDGMKRITAIVQGLNAFARRDGLTAERVDINKAIDTALQIVWNELKYDYTVTVENKVHMATYAIPGQLEQVLVNLLINARDATPHGGTIAVSLKERGGNAVLSVSDNGSGIPEEQLKKIFDPFFTTKPVGSGTGLGLAICHEIVANSGGMINVESTPGEGTLFEIVLPTAPFPVEELDAAE